MEPEPVKPGYLTTEFWLALATQAIAVLVLLGFISAVDQQALNSSIASAIQNAAALVTAAAAVWKFIQSRSDVKAANSNAVAAVAEQKSSENRLTIAERKKQ